MTYYVQPIEIGVKRQFPINAREMRSNIRITIPRYQKIKTDAPVNDVCKCSVYNSISI